MKCVVVHFAQFRSNSDYRRAVYALGQALEGYEEQPIIGNNYDNRTIICDGPEAVVDATVEAINEAGFDVVRIQPAVSAEALAA